MRGRRIIQLTIVFAAIGLAGYWLVNMAGPQAERESARDTPQATTDDDVADQLKQPARPASAEQITDPSESQSDGPADCISPTELESDPVLAEEFARLDAVITSGPTIASYRGLSPAQLNELAVQGDSAAMAVLGAVSVMRARKLPEDKAVAFLLREERELWSFSLPQPLATDVASHLQEARDWFYRSALHGRVMALRNAGEVIAIVSGTPVELGWIDEDDYESLEPNERFSLDPATVYESLAFEIAPQLRSGPFGAAISELTEGGERQQSVLDVLALQFNEDREAANLPPIEIPESAAPPMQVLEAMLCEPYLDSVR